MKITVFSFLGARELPELTAVLLHLHGVEVEMIQFEDHNERVPRPFRNCGLGPAVQLPNGVVVGPDEIASRGSSGLKSRSFQEAAP